VALIFCKITEILHLWHLDDENLSFIAFTRPELKFGLIEESPLKRTGDPAVTDVESVSTDFPPLARTFSHGRVVEPTENAARSQITDLLFKK